MTEVAGEVGDGFLVHGFSTERYLREVSLPALERGAAKAGKTRADLTVSYPGFVVTGPDEQSMEAAAKGVREQIAFYGSTPAYRPVLELHGWGDLQPELNTLSKRGEWVKMGELIDDDILNAFAVVARSTRWPPRSSAASGTLVDRFSFYAPYKVDPEMWTERPGRVPLGPELVRAVSGAAVLDDDVDQARRADDDPLRRRPAQCVDHLGRAQCGRLGVALRNVGVDLYAVPHLAVDLNDHRHGVLADELGVEAWASAAGGPRARRGGAAPTARRSRAGT